MHHIKHHKRFVRKLNERVSNDKDVQIARLQLEVMYCKANEIYRKMKLDELIAK